MDGNFHFLAPHWPALAARGAEAEALFYRDPHACLMKLRYFLEALLATVLEREGLARGESSLEQMITLLRGRKLPDDLARAMHQLRVLGNEAAHEGKDHHLDAEHALTIAHRAAGWAASRYHEVRERPAFRYPPAGFHLANGYPAAFARLDPPARAAAEALQARLQADPGAEAFRYALVSGRADSYVRSLDVDGTHRMIFVIGPRRDVYVLAFIDRAEAALAWARAMRVEVHPLTGALQLFGAAPAPEAGPADGEPLFAHVSDEDLAWTGLPEALVPLVRGVRHAARLEALRAQLPEEAFEALWAIAHGRELHAILAERSDTRPTAPVDPANFAAAASTPDARRRIVAISSPEELAEILAAPLEAWRVFLHPRQERLARADFAGPTRVLGGAGTGKTVVLMHRARHLARDTFPAGRVLLLTYTRTLADQIRAQLATIAGPELARLEVLNVHAAARAVLEAAGEPIDFLPREEEDAVWAEVFASAELGELGPRFYRNEWTEVVMAQGVGTLEAYLEAAREGRAIPLGAAQRQEVWAVFEAYRQALAARGKLDFAEQIRRATAALAGARPPYAAVLVDETQDMGPVEFAFARALAPRGPNDLFFVGDVYQKIFPRRADLAACGIALEDRTEVLRINYRTTSQIRDWAMEALGDQAGEDLDGGERSLEGYVSVRSGPAPAVRVFPTADAELAAVVAHVAGLTAHDEPASIALVSYHRQALPAFRQALAAAGIPAEILQGMAQPGLGVVVATMHRVKGLEFKHVIIVGLNADDVPPRQADAPLEPAAWRRARRLLYTTAARARDSLWVTAAGEPSALLPAP